MQSANEVVVDEVVQMKDYFFDVCRALMEDYKSPFPLYVRKNGRLEIYDGSHNIGTTLTTKFPNLTLEIILRIVERDQTKTVKFNVPDCDEQFEMEIKFM